MTTMTKHCNLGIGHWGGRLLVAASTPWQDLLSPGKEIFGKSPGSRGKRVA